MPSVPTPSKSGIIETRSGERHIPSSVRPDGTERKEIKIRPGYKPPEDVEVYKNRTADTWKSRGSNGVPGAEALLKNTENETGPTASSKNAKRREARRKAKAVGEICEENENRDEKDSGGNMAEKNDRDDEVDPEVEKQKKAKALVKKLRQANELKEKKEGGTALLPEQFAKVIKISHLTEELEKLGLDSEGKPTASAD